MSEEIMRRLQDAAAAHGTGIESDASVIVSSVIGKARRRRRVTATLTATGAFVGAMAMVGASLALVDSLRADELSPGTDGASATEGPRVRASDDPSPTADVISDYPPAASDRGEGFPAAYEMRDWVWDYVGEGWSLESYSASHDPFVVKTAALPAAVVYLASPEGDLFELAELEPERSAGLKVVSWDETNRYAHVVWDGDEEAGIAAGGGELNLETGAITPIVFTTPWGVSSTVAAIAVSADGTELWEAWLGDHQRFYRFGPEQGWSVASVNDLEGISDRTVWPRWDIAKTEGDARLVTRPDSAAVLFELRASDASAPSTIAVYDLKTDSYTTADVVDDLAPLTEGACLADGLVVAAGVVVAEWVGDATLSYSCGDAVVDIAVGSDRGASEGVDYGPPADITGVDSGAAGVAKRTGVVGYREATSVTYLAGP